MFLSIISSTFNSGKCRWNSRLDEINQWLTDHLLSNDHTKGSYHKGQNVRDRSRLCNNMQCWGFGSLPFLGQVSLTTVCQWGDGRANCAGDTAACLGFLDPLCGIIPRTSLYWVIVYIHTSMSNRTKLYCIRYLSLIIFFLFLNKVLRKSPTNLFRRHFI